MFYTDGNSVYLLYTQYSKQAHYDKLVCDRATRSCTALKSPPCWSEFTCDRVEFLLLLHLPGLALPHLRVHGVLAQGKAGQHYSSSGQGRSTVLNGRSRRINATQAQSKVLQHYSSSGQGSSTLRKLISGYVNTSQAH